MMIYLGSILRSKSIYLNVERTFAIEILQWAGTFRRMALKKRLQFYTGEVVVHSERFIVQLAETAQRCNIFSLFLIFEKAMRQKEKNIWKENEAGSKGRLNQEILNKGFDGVRRQTKNTKGAKEQREVWSQVDEISALKILIQRFAEWASDYGMSLSQWGTLSQHPASSATTAMSEHSRPTMPLFNEMQLQWRTRSSVSILTSLSTNQNHLILLNTDCLIDHVRTNTG